MKNQKGKVFFYDSEEEYAELMSDYLRKHMNVPWDIRTFTKREELLLAPAEEAEVLVIAESDYFDEVDNHFTARKVVLSESGIAKWKDVYYVDKYQEAEEVFKVLLGIYMDTSDVPLIPRKGQRDAVFIGNYSPARHDYQTSFALTMSQILAKEHRTLYLNFEHYAGVEELMCPAGAMDLADLLYFLNAGEDRFRLRLQTMIKHIGLLDYVPPMKVGENLLAVTGEEWLKLLKKLTAMGEYEYIILDLSESIQGLFDILRICTRVYTITTKDKAGKCKIMQYEHLLETQKYQDVMEKTVHTKAERIGRIPGDLEQLTKGELAELVRSLVRDLKEGNGEEQ